MRESHHLFINGEWIAGEGTERAILNPANESKIFISSGSFKETSFRCSFCSTFSI
ncbi:hypothetical protein DFO73_10937 [Cytobacillus oceanisediminis]|jgi:hypothetical protein|uniref:Uncharacterized protein n=1 Tax=Cytobacillus oceanisediminis TaxID=665099 RepID=A0A2V2ZSA8_9BACI|nr:hypothetical protein [Cytobacillus oceanisediminis]PWW26874.1 hypothetical protein DFO73_10937 [Cytobacillus oceanisediminis]